jgi:hypothetical protein
MLPDGAVPMLDLLPLRSAARPAFPLLACFAVACGGTTGAASADAGNPDVSLSDVAPDTSASDGPRPGDDGGTPPADAADAARDGGWLALGCAPNDGDPIAQPFPACTFVSENACQTDGDCGCGCSCQCGVCNCDAAGKLSQCGQGTPCCSGAGDCGPTCYGLTCVGSQCVPSNSGSSPWIGTWEGTFNWPTKTYFATCAGGLGSPASTGSVGGKFKLRVSGDGNQLTFFLVSQQGSSQPLCALPFLVAGNTATLVASSACVTIGAPQNFCGNGPPSVAIQTFAGGQAMLAGASMTLQFQDVFAMPAAGNVQCQVPPPGLDQVNVESMTATLQLSPDGG